MHDPSLNERTSLVYWPMIWAVLGLMALGVAFIYSATRITDLPSEARWFEQSHLRQAIFYVAGLGTALTVSWVDYRSLSRWALVVYWGTILSLVLVLVMGTVRYGARRWFDLGLFQVQPSEFAKLGYILMMGHFLSRPLEELRRPSVFWICLGMTLLPFALILKEPDLGSALLLFPTGLVMMFVAGIPSRFLRRLVGGVGLLALLVVADVLFAPAHWQIRLQEYQRQRLLVYFNRPFAPPDASPEEQAAARELQRDRSHNVIQAMISVGSGGLAGKGWGQGTQNSLGYLPRAVAHNDFIFSVIAEEKGFIGSITVLSLYAVLLFSGVRIADQARDRLGKLLSIGVTTLLFSQVFINIGMNIRLLPVTGVPLPLLSYGGSSVVTALIAMGLLQNVYRHRKSY